MNKLQKLHIFVTAGGLAFPRGLRRNGSNEVSGGISEPETRAARGEQRPISVPAGRRRRRDEPFHPHPVGALRDRGGRKPFPGADAEG